MQIILARLNQDFRVVRTGRTDLGEKPTLEAINVPVAMVWVNKGTESDLAKARVYAEKEGYSVLCYTGEKDPLARAKKEISA